jgi:hypothetical protein
VARTSERQNSTLQALIALQNGRAKKLKIQANFRGMEEILAPAQRARDFPFPKFFNIRLSLRE